MKGKMTFEQAEPESVALRLEDIAQKMMEIEVPRLYPPVISKEEQEMRRHIDAYAYKSMFAPERTFEQRYGRFINTV